MSIFRHTLTFLAAATLAGPVLAQDEVQILPAPADGEGFYGKESSQGIYVRDSAVALEKFPLVNRLERLGEWSKAADLLQEVLEKYPDRVIQSATDEKGQIIRYTSVANAVQQQIARWPAEGLAAYRARFEAPAQVLLDAADPDNISALRQVYSLYFNTEPGLRAGLRLVDLSFRSGDFRAAADVSAELLAWHPLATGVRPALLFRAGLSHHLAGDAEKARAYHDELAQQFPNATGTVRGQSVPLAETLAQELEQAPTVAGGISPDHWPMLGGADSRGRISSAQGRPGARLFRVPLTERISPQARPEVRLQMEAQDEHARSQGAMIGIIPVADAGELFFQDGKRIYGVSLESGLPLPGWAQTHGGDGGGAYTDPDTTPLPASQQLTVTVTDDAVLAIMGLPEPQNPYAGQRNTASNAQSRIVCLDRATGRLRWMVRPTDLPDDGASLRSLVFTGSPLVVGDSVHFIGRGGKSTQFEDCYVITLNLADGQHKWSTYVVSANTENMTMWGRGSSVLSPEGTSHLAHASGRLFVQTNLGATAALDAYSGTIRWLSIYQRNIITDPRAMRRFGRQQAISLPKPWSYNPAIVQDGRLFVLPSDSDELLIYDVLTGEPVKALQTKHLGDPDTLIGVWDEKLIVSSEFRITCLDWQAYQAETFRENDPSVIQWISSFPEEGSEENINPIRGRGFLTTDSVFIPTRQGLFRIDLRNGRRVEQYPSDQQGRWAADEGAGNVLVTSDRVIVAGDRSVNVYTDLAMARAKLDAEVAAAPTDPAPRLRYAEVMFVAGQTDVALAKLDEAIDLLGGRDQMRSGPQRDRLFTAALGFAEKAAAVDTPEAMELAHQLYERAAVAAASPSHQVHYRLSRSRLADRQGDLPMVVQLYQEILLDPALREVTLNDARSGGATQAAVVAEREIGQVIRQSGRALYQPYEQAARDAFEQARAGEQADALLDIARRYPNATVAPEALLAAAQSYEQANDHRRATQTLRQITFKYGESFDRVRVIESMVRNYLAMPGSVDVALSRLNYGVRVADNPVLSQPLTLPDGQTLPAGTAFREAALKLRDHQAQSSAPVVPRFGLPSHQWANANRGRSPLDHERAIAIPGIDAILAPQPEHARYDRIIAWSAAQGLAIYDVGQPTPRGIASTVTPPPQEAAWTSAGLLVRTANQLALLDGDSAEVRWSVQLDSLPDAALVAPADDPASLNRRPTVRVEPVVVQGRVQLINNRAVARPVLAVPDPVEGPEQLLQMRLTGDRAIATTSTGRVIALDLAGGKLAWQTRLLEDRPLDRLATNNDFAVVRVISDSSVQLVVLDTLSGELVSRRVFSPDGAKVPVNFALAGDGTLVYALPDRLCGKDLYEPGDQLNWEVPGQAPGRRTFHGATAPDHLQIQGDRIIVLSDEGQFVRVHSLETGKVLRYPSGRGDQQVDALLGTESRGWDTRLIVSGPHLYVMSNKALVAYNLDHPQQTWRGMIDPTEPHNFRGAAVGSDYLVLFESLAQAPDVAAPSTTYRLYAYSRAKMKSGESGRIEHTPDVRNPAGIESWLAVNGGFYYLAADDTLHFLPAVVEQPAE